MMKDGSPLSQFFRGSQGWMSKMEDQVRMAERALLYQLGFVVHVALPYDCVDTMVVYAWKWDKRTFPNRS